MKLIFLTSVDGRMLKYKLMVRMQCCGTRMTMLFLKKQYVQKGSMILRILLILKGHKKKMKRRKTCQQVEKGKEKKKVRSFKNLS